ncbi:MAG: ribosomal protein S18-alanine N-acetyltransferase [Acidimicrobiales bacterium]
MTSRPLSGAPPEDLTVTVERMHRRHLGAVLRIEQAVHPRPWSERLFRGELALAGSRSYIVARVGPTVVGFAGVMVMAGDAHVTNVAVDPAWRRRGIATRLVARLMHETVARGVEQITLEVRVSNTAARELYRRFGFAPGGVRERYYVDNHEDALIMWAHKLGSVGSNERVAAAEATVRGATRSVGFDDPAEVAVAAVSDEGASRQ